MGNLNPYYNESFIFIVEQEQLRVGGLKLYLSLKYFWGDKSFVKRSRIYNWQIPGLANIDYDVDTL